MIVRDGCVTYNMHVLQVESSLKSNLISPCMKKPWQAELSQSTDVTTAWANCIQQLIALMHHQIMTSLFVIYNSFITKKLKIKS